MDLTSDFLAAFGLTFGARNVISEVHISSLVIQAIPHFLPNIEKQIDAYPYSELGMSDQKQGKLVLILETTSLADLKKSIRHFESMEGVLSAAMVYHHVDSPSPRVHFEYRGVQVGT